MKHYTNDHRTEYRRVPEPGEVVLLNHDRRFWLVRRWIWCHQHDQLEGLLVVPEGPEMSSWDFADLRRCRLSDVDSILLAWAGMTLAAK